MSSLKDFFTSAGAKHQASVNSATSTLKAEQAKLEAAQNALTLLNQPSGALTVAQVETLYQLQQEV